MGRRSQCSGQGVEFFGDADVVVGRQVDATQDGVRGAPERGEAAELAGHRPARHGIDQRFGVQAQELLDGFRASGAQHFFHEGGAVLHEGFATRALVQCSFASRRKDSADESVFRDRQHQVVEATPDGVDGVGGELHRPNLALHPGVVQRQEE